MTDKTQNDVLKILKNIKKDQGKDETQTEDKVIPEVEQDAPKPEVRGIPKSGRFWKTKKERYTII